MLFVHDFRGCVSIFCVFVCSSSVHVYIIKWMSFCECKLLAVYYCCFIYLFVAWAFLISAHQYIHFIFILCFFSVSSLTFSRWLWFLSLQPSICEIDFGFCFFPSFCWTFPPFFAKGIFLFKFYSIPMAFKLPINMSHECDKKCLKTQWKKRRKTKRKKNFTLNNLTN